MTIRASHLLWVVLAVAVAVWAVARLGSDDARRIRRRLGELERLIEKAEGESNLVGAGKVRRLGELFAPELEVAIEPYSQTVSGRSELARVTMAYRSRSAAIDVAFRAVELDVDAASRTARLDAVAVLSGDDARRESYRVSFAWQKLGDEWLIRRVDVLEVLENPLL